MFCSEHRPKIKEDHPGISIGDIAKKLGELWSTQTPKDRAPYAAKATKLKEKYEKVSTCSLNYSFKYFNYSLLSNDYPHVFSILFKSILDITFVGQPL